MPLLVVMAGCGAPPATTGLIVEVGSEMTVPAELDGLTLLVRSGGAWNLEKSFDLGIGPGRVTLPVRLGLTSESSGGRLNVEARGLQGGREQIRRIRTVDFVPGKVVEVKLTLERACRGVVCPPGLTCVPRDEACRLPSSPEAARDGVPTTGPRWIDRTPVPLPTDWTWPEPPAESDRAQSGLLVHESLYERTTWVRDSVLWRWDARQGTWTSRLAGGLRQHRGPIWLDEKRHLFIAFGRWGMSELDPESGSWTERRDQSLAAQSPQRPVVGVLDSSEQRVLAVQTDQYFSPPVMPPSIGTVEVWQWTIETGLWSKYLETAGTFWPSAAGWDTDRGRAIFFGYDHTGQRLTLEWEDSKRVELRPASPSPFGPNGGGCSNLAYHQKRQSFVGLCPDGLWEWTHATSWKLIDDSHKAAGPTAAWLAYDRNRQRLVHFGDGRLREWMDGARASP